MTSDLEQLNAVVTRWTNTKLSWRDKREPVLWRPGSATLSDATDQMDLAAAEMMGLFGSRDPVWWDSLGELAQMVKSRIQK